MKSMVLGAGSIGSLFAGKLAYQGYNTTAIAREEHVTHINKDGLHVIEDNEELISFLKADLAPYRLMSDIDLLIVTTKAFDNHLVVKQIKNILEPDIPILILQNGMGNEIIYERTFPNNPVYRAITTEGAELIKPGTVKHLGHGITQFGIVNGYTDSYSKEIQDMLTLSGFKTEKKEDIDYYVWVKLLINIAINPLGSILGVPNGNILNRSNIQKLLYSTLNEGLEVAHASLPRYDFSSVPQIVEDVLFKTSENKCSMLQDLERGRKTEIDYLNGYIVRRGHELGINTPVNKALVEIIKKFESGHN